MDNVDGLARLQYASEPRLHVTRLHPELQDALADQMDFPTALLWRTVCRMTYTTVTSSLRRSLRRVLSPYIPHVGSFLQQLTNHRAVVGGLAAVAYLLRDYGIRGERLEVYAPSTLYRSLVEGIASCPANGAAVTERNVQTSTDAITAQREISEVATLKFLGKGTVVIYASSTITPISCIARSPYTALMNFVTEHSVGCAFPSLTFRRRSLLCDFRLAGASPTDFEDMNTLLSHGFHFAVSPSVWHPRGGGEDGCDVHCGLGHNTFPCMRTKFICPLQGRYFGGAGSPVALLDPLGPELARARVLGVPPFGPMVAWRLLTSFECSEDCDGSDLVLDDNLITTLMMVLHSPFPSSASDPLS